MEKESKKKNEWKDVEVFIEGKKVEGLASFSYNEPVVIRKNAEDNWEFKQRKVVPEVYILNREQMALLLKALGVVPLYGVGDKPVALEEPVENPLDYEKDDVIEFWKDWTREEFLSLD